jgi:hypothetical protein
MARTSFRNRARSVAAKLGQPVPDWAAHLALRSTKRADDTKPASARPARGSIVVPCELPPALKAWRARARAGIVRVSTRVVELHELGAPVLRFDSLDAALLAIESSEPQCSVL